jgi:predicted membrane-bound mannosyltransferase
LASNQSEPRWVLWLEWGIVIGIIALATFLRYWRLEEVPPGFNSDEAVGAMGALTSLREGLRYSYEGQGGGGALGFYFATAAFYLFGPSIATIRGLVAWAGVVSIFANYWAVREAFRNHGLKQARWLAGLSTLGLTVSLWHLGASRVVFAAIGVPFLMLPSVYFLWWGLNRHTHRWPFVVSGIFLGGLMYIYLAGVFAPPFYAAFFIAQWLIIKFWQKAKTWGRQAERNPKPKIS